MESFTACPVAERPPETANPFSAEEMQEANRWLNPIQEARGDATPPLMVLYANKFDATERAKAEWARVLLVSVQKNTIRVCPQETSSSVVSSSIVVGLAMPVWGIRIVPVASKPAPFDPTPLTKAVEAMAVTTDVLRREQAEQQKAHTELVEKLLAAQQKTSKATEENTKLQSSILARAYTAISTHDEDLPMVSLESKVRLDIPRFCFPPFPVAGVKANETLGASTEKALNVYESAAKVALKIVAGSLSPDERKTMQVRCGTSKATRAHIVQLMICAANPSSANPSSGKYTLREAIFIGLDYVLADTNHPLHKEQHNVRLKFEVAALAPNNVTEMMEAQLSKKLVAPVEDLDNLFLSLYDVKPLIDLEASPKVASKKKSKGKCPNKGGGGGDGAEGGGPKVDPGPRAVPLATVAPAGPFYQDLIPKAYIADWLLDFVNMALSAIHPRPEVKVLGADLIRAWVARRAESELQRWLSSQRTDPMILAPLLVRGDHWVLLRITRYAITIFDSLRSHTGDEAHRFARSLRDTFPILKDARVESERHWPQQAQGSNDCAIFVMRATQHILSRRPVTAVLHLFERGALNLVFPHIPGADRDGVRSTAFLATLYLDATKKTFAARLREHLAEPAPRSALPAPIATPQKAPSPPVPAASAHQHSTSTPATAKPPPKQSAVAPPPQAPTTKPCAWPQCTNTVTHPHGRSCEDCGGRFCTRHRGRWAGKAGQSKWRCGKCVEAHSMSTPCGHHKCTIQGGVVKLMEAITCTECKRLFHKRHASTYDHVKLEFHCGDCKKGYHKQEGGNFSMVPGTGSARAPDASKTQSPPEGTRDPGGLGFRVGQGSPLLATTAGKFLASLKGNMRTVMHPLADKGISTESRREHVRLLFLMLAKAPIESHDWPIARMILEVLVRERIHQRWSWVTMENKIGQVSSALARLPQYTEGALPAMQLTHDHEWRDASRHIRRLSKRAMPTGLPSVTEAEIVRMIETSNDPQIKAALILIWACVARSGDVSQLMTADVSVGQVRNPQRGRRAPLEVFFKRGKVIGKIDPYTIHTAIPETWAAWLKKFLDDTKTEYLFQMPSKAARQRFLDRIRAHVRTVAPRCDLRALRRGSAQNLAEKGIALSTIMLFTRHADVCMLRRYLRFGKTLSEEANKGTSAASKIWPMSC